MKQHSPNGKLEVKELKITYEGIETKWTKMTPKSLRKKVTQIQEYTQSNPQKAIQEISKIYLRHRELPILNNVSVHSPLCVLGPDKKHIDR